MRTDARRPPPVRLVLFDIDGTLIRTKGVGVQAFYRALASAFGVNHAPSSIRFGGRTDTSLVRELFRLTGILPTPEHFQQFFDSYVFWLDHLLGENRSGTVCPGVREFVRALRQLTEPPLLGLLTGNIRLGAEIKLRHFGLWEIFEIGGFGDDHEDRNQIAVTVRHRASRHLNRPLSGEEIVVGGDTVHDVNCARAIDARALAVATGGATWAELEACSPDWLLPDLTEANAAVICAPRSVSGYGAERIGDRGGERTASAERVQANLGQITI